MQNKLKIMMKKSSFEAFRLTEKGYLEVQGPNPKISDNYFLYDGKHYYFGNPLIQLSSSEIPHGNLILAMTDTKMLIPQGNNEYRYIARNYPANSDLLVIVLYYHDKYLYYTVVSGSGSGRVHPVCLAFTEDRFNFCFHLAVEAITSVNPELGETLFSYLKEKISEAKNKIGEDESQ